MPEISEIERLEIQKRLLVAKSEIYRQTLEFEFYKIQSATAWVQKPIGLMKSVLPWIVLAAPVAGYCLGARRRSLKTLFGKAVFGLVLAGRFIRFWEAIRAKPGTVPARLAT